MRLLILAAAAALIVSPAYASGGTGTGKGSPESTTTSTMSAATTAPSVGLMVIHHKVADYAKWRPAYDAHKPMRDAAGLTFCEVRQPIGDASDVFVACNMTDVAKAKAFAASQDLKDAMAKAGVMGTPEIHFLSLPK